MPRVEPVMIATLPLRSNRSIHLLASIDCAGLARFRPGGLRKKRYFLHGGCRMTARCVPVDHPFLDALNNADRAEEVVGEVPVQILQPFPPGRIAVTRHYLIQRW